MAKIFLFSGKKIVVRMAVDKSRGDDETGAINDVIRYIW